MIAVVDKLLSSAFACSSIFASIFRESALWLSDFIIAFDITLFIAFGFITEKSKRLKLLFSIYAFASAVAESIDSVSIKSAKLSISTLDAFAPDKMIVLPLLLIIKPFLSS